MMSFGTAISTCFRKYITFSGRARRPEYWYFILFYILGSIVATVVDTVLLEGSPVLTFVFILVMLLPLYAVTWRRLHDRGRPGYWVLMPFFIILVAVAISLLFFASGAIDAEVLAAMSEGDGALEPAVMIVGGVFAVAYLAAIIVSIVVFVWTLLGSQSGPNRFGPEPGSAVAVEGVFE